mmetsp:Transcript_105762/g.304109  ORF Transcript_105762/g.304109 Transcript_105762/m.304109 type:complete len:112 (+) Transcript_105762:510-845(+)
MANGFLGGWNRRLPSVCWQRCRSDIDVVGGRRPLLVLLQGQLVGPFAVSILALLHTSLGSCSAKGPHTQRSTVLACFKAKQSPPKAGMSLPATAAMSSFDATDSAAHRSKF